MTDLVRVDVNTDVEQYPVLAISEWAEYSNPRRDLRIPAEMLNRLVDAEHAVDQAKADIMRYLGERHAYSDIREWLAKHPTT